MCIITQFPMNRWSAPGGPPAVPSCTTSWDIQLLQRRVQRLVVRVVQVPTVYHVRPDVRCYHRILFHRPRYLLHRLLNPVNWRSRDTLHPSAVRRAEVRQPVVVPLAYRRRQLRVQPAGLGSGKTQYRRRRVHRRDVYPLSLQGHHLRLRPEPVRPTLVILRHPLCEGLPGQVPRWVASRAVG